MPLPVIRVFLYKVGFTHVIISKTDFEWIKENSLDVLKKHSDEKFGEDLGKWYDHFEEVQLGYENIPVIIK